MADKALRDRRCRHQSCDAGYFGDKFVEPTVNRLQLLAQCLQLTRLGSDSFFALLPLLPPQAARGLF